ncbi:hypothetical protein LCGC14_1997110 [marine sediment metagenome]|uniref:FAD dependent oxidoreductase domain-containing protein n=1 Tax=marine sediment metagenome TaxID=412755 RepID=A0A0F9HHT3_9ZZZZ
MDEVDVAIIGAGVVGLAIARELAGKFDDIVVLERQGGYGRGISSRNSEVIHAGIYYPPGSLKAITCVEGSALLYDYCNRNSIPHQKTGKLIVAVDQSEEPALDELYNNGLSNGVSGLDIIRSKEVHKIEPNVIVHSAIHSIETGIVNAHGLMDSLYRGAVSSGVVFSFNTEVEIVEREKKGYVIGVKEESYRFMARRVINSAGLASDHIASLAGIDVDSAGYRLEYRKGSYFSYHAESPVKTLVYPIPRKDAKGLGIHATLDLNGNLRFGPDSECVGEIEFKVDESKRGEFFRSASKYMSGLDRECLSPDFAGVRPSLKGEGFRDFIIKHESDRGLYGLVNLIGIDSPGLTACLSIARNVNALLEEYLTE